ncbi:MAG: DUF6528 family protein [Candidatus Cryptobacteroides sp.]
MTRKHIILLIAVPLLFLASCGKEYGDIIPLPPLEQPEGSTLKKLAIVDSSDDKVLIVNALTKEIEWSWSVEETDLLPAAKARFGLLDEVKPVYDEKYLLITATRGAVAIVRISDKKLMFYAFPMGYPHSAEILPDGNVVVACSDDGSSAGNALKIFSVDTVRVYTEQPLFEVDNYFAHNVVWDIESELLWATANDVINAWTYDAEAHILAVKETYQLPDDQAHELFPVYGFRQLWLTTHYGIYKFDVKSHVFTKVNASTNTNIKCVSSGSAEYETVLIYPTEQYWTERVIDTGGRVVYSKPGAHFYKARWMLDNAFSYPDDNPFKISAK